MNWTPRQIAMLAEMGLHVPFVAPTPAAPAAPPLPLAGEGQGEGGSRDSERPTTAPTLTPTLSRPAGEGAERLARPDASRPAREGVARLGWSELREAVASCTACGLAGSRTQTVFGVGLQQAHWLLVGEAPGEQEDLQGEPFVGKSGQLLDNMLAAIGLSRNEGEPGAETPSPATRVYIANTLKCRPPGNRNPTPEELATCEPFLVRQLELLKPKIILAMGRFAVQRLLRTDEPIGRLRGRVHRYHDVPLIVTYHPAYLLRQQQDKARAWDDLCLALETYRAATSSA